ncbi:hypothetical protein Tco_0252006 [Tanacetum coccineum]
MSTPKFADTHNLVVFLEKPEESNGFHEIIDFLNANRIRYALTVNPTIYTSCIEQFWATAKVKTVNGERQLQALVDKKKVIITETSIRSDLNLEYVCGTDCWPTDTIFEELARIGYEKPSPKLTFYKAFFSPQWKFLIHIITQCLSAKTTAWNEFSSTMASAIICLAINQKFYLSKYIFDAMIKSSRKQSKDSAPTKSITEETIPEENVATPSCDPPQSGEDRMKLIELMNLCTQLQSRVLVLETRKSNQALEIESLKRRVKIFEKRRKSRTPGFKRLMKVRSASRVESTNDTSLGAQEDASKQGRKIDDLDADEEVTLVDETQEMNDDNLMFDTDVLEEHEKDVTEKEVSAADPVTTAGEVVTTANVEVTIATTIDELTLAQTLIEIKAAKPKAITYVATTTTTTRPKNFEAQLQAELIEEERIARQKEEEANIALLESWDNTQAMMDAYFQLAQQMQTEEQEQLSIKEKSKLFVELLEKRKKHFAALRAQEKRSKPPTKAQKRNTMSTNLKNIAEYKHNQLRAKTKVEGSSKRAGDELEQEKAKKQKGDDDQEDAEMKRHIEIVKHDEIDKDGRMGYFKLIRAYGSSKRYSSMIKMLQGIYREDLETLWKLVKAKHENTSPEDDYERVLWGDLKVMFEPVIKSDV